MPRTSNENLISGTQADRLSVTLDAEQLVKDTTTQALFVGDGSTAGGRAVDVRPISDITGNYTLVRADEGKILRFNSASAITVTIPTNASVGYPVNLTRIPFINLGAGVVTIVGDTGVTLTSIESNVDSKESGEIHKTATNTWYVTKGGAGASAINELSDVNITSLQNQQTLRYNSTSGKWENVTSTDANTTYDLAVPASTTNLRLTGSDGSTDNVTLTGAGATSIARTSGTELTVTSTNTTYGVLIPTGTTSLRLLGSDSSTDDISIVGGTNTTVTRTSDSILTLASNDTTYSLGTSSAGSNATIDLTAGGSGSGTDSVTLAAGSNITISETGDTITFAGTAGTVTSVTGSSPISVSSGTTTPAISISQADASTNGFLSSSDWSTFNSRLSSVGITSGGGLSVSGSPLTSNGSITLTNTGVTSNVAGTGISVSSGTGAVTITNTDLGSSQNIFKTVAISGQDSIVADSNSDTLTLAEGSNITLTTNAGTDTITIAGTDTTYSAGTGLNLTGTTFSNTDLGSAQNIFKTIAVSGQSDIVADSNTDTLTFAAGSNVSLTTTAGTDTLTIASTDTNYSAGSGLDLAGTTFSVDVSDFMANGVNNRILTASGADSINAESGLTFDGSTLNVGGSVIISSDLTVNGTTTTINTQTLSVDDPMVVVGDNNSANSVDLGIIGKYVDTNTYYSGLLRDASAGKFRLFTTTQDLSSATTVDPTNGGYANADLIAGAIQQSGATNGIVYADSNGNLLGGRTISEGVGIDITNGSAVSGNPTIALDLSELTTSTSNADGDFFVVVDTGNAQKKLTKANINISGFNNDSGFTTNTGTVTSVGLAGDSGSTAITTSGTFTIAGGTNVTTSLSGSTLTIAATDTNTVYSAGDGLDLSGTTFSTDLKSNGGLVIESTELAVDLGASSITGTLAISDGGTGATSAGSARTNLGLGSLATLSSVAFSNIAPAAVQLSSESFTDVDTTLMTSAAIQDKILSFGYTTNTGTTTASNTQTFTNKSGNISQWTNDSGYTTNVGDITAVVAGAGLSGGATSGSATLSIPNQGSVSAGSYTNTNITVDARGIITDISNGSSGSTPNNSTITITAGTGLSGGGDFTTNQSSNETLTMNIDSTVATLTGTQTLTNKTLTSPTIATPTITGTLAATGDIDISSQYGRLNFKKDSNGNVNNDAIFFYNSSNSIAGGITYMHSSNQLRLRANGDDQIYITDGAIYPPVDNDVDLGTSSLKFKDSFFALVDAENFKINGGQGSDGQVLTSTGSGVAWETPNVGDITGVTAGTGLSGGGTSGTVTLNIDSTVATLTGSQTLTNKTLTSPILTSPQLGGNLDTAGYEIVSTSNQHISITPNGTGDIQLNADTIRVGDSSSDVTIAPNISGTTAKLQFQSDGDTLLRAASGNGNMYLNANALMSLQAATFRFGTNGGNPTLTTLGTSDLTLNTNSGTNSGSIVIADGANSDISITPNGTGQVNLGNFQFDVDQTVGSGQDNYVLTYDHANTQISLEAAAGGGISWSTAVDANIVPDTDNAYDIGSASNEFRHAYFDGTVNCDGINIAGDMIAGNSSLKIIGGGSQESRAHIFLPNNETQMKILGSSSSNTDIILDTRYTSGTGEIQLKTKGSTRFAVGANGEFLVGGSAAGSSGQVLTSGGASSAPSWTTISSGDSWGDAVDANIIPDTNNTYTLGSASKKFGSAYFAGTSYNTLLSSANGSAAYPTYTFEVDENTGMYRGGTDILGFSTAGTERMTISASGAITFNQAITFPTADGTSGQVLKTNGSGTLSFGDAGGGETYNPLRFTNGGHSTATSNTFLPTMPMTGTNSFNASQPFYFAQKIYMIPMWSASGGTLNRIKLHATNDLPVAGQDDWKIAIYEAGDDGWPETLLTTPYQWTPTSAWGTTLVSIYGTNGSSQITLDANKWYWLAYLGASSTNGDNVTFGVVSASKAVPLSFAGTINYNNVIYWNAASTSFPSTFTVSSSLNRWQPSQVNNLPRTAFDYVVDSGTGNWA